MTAGVAVLTLLLFGTLLALRQACRLAARAAHEVRGPLTVSLLALEGMVTRHELAGEHARGLELQLRRARLAVDDLTAAPRGGRAPDRREPLLVRDLLAQLALSWRPVAAAQGAQLRVAGAVGDGAVLADRTRLAQAAGNLIANALEHGAGPVEVRARDVGGRLRLEIRDGGTGLPAPLGTLSRRPRRGRGHGLAITADIAQRHGGRLLAGPSAGGATVALELPLYEGWPAAGDDLAPAGSAAAWLAAPLDEDDE
ncbi:MAG: two-component system, OmpR family, sensor kinase [Solirubrobacteraceae bacterium]|nr:two-component system, OmpR family, sensor kinase [Solirubrobacteraceae bacterium]